MAIGVNSEPQSILVFYLVFTVEDSHELKHLGTVNVQFIILNTRCLALKILLWHNFHRKNSLLMIKLEILLALF